MLQDYSLCDEVCVQSHNHLREKPLELKEIARTTGKIRGKKRGSGEHWLRPVIRAIASEPRRSLAIRAPAAA